MLRNHSRRHGALAWPTLLLALTLSGAAGCSGDPGTPTPDDTETPVVTPTASVGTDTPDTSTPVTATPTPTDAPTPTDSPEPTPTYPPPTPTPPEDGDGDGFSEADGDCNDNNGDIFPTAEEVCDSVDNNCDGETDGPDSADAHIYYQDHDGDGYGANVEGTSACDMPTGYITVSGDCDDDRVSVNPDADEVCDTIDNDCDGTIDQNAVDGGQNYYPDQDDDGFGWAAGVVNACSAPEGYIIDSQDCDDNNADANPNGTEVPYNGVDDDCSNGDLVDQDNDGSPSCEVASAPCDCADLDATIYPERPEILNGIDDNCNGNVDEGSSAFDDDGDGYSENEGDCDDGRKDVSPAGTEGTACDSVDQDCDGKPDDGLSCHDDDGDGYSEDQKDCNDAEPAVNPGAAEGPACDGIDTDCDGKTDDGLTCKDDDGDGLNEDQGDCNDADASVHPGATEATSCDGIDTDCSGQDLDARCLDQDLDGVTGEKGDCNDNSAAVYPGATEVYDGLDNDCDELTDEGMVPEGGLIITEVLNRAAVNDEYGEWFEVYNASLYPIDVYKWEFKDNTGKFTVATHVVIPSKGFGSFGNCGDTTLNGNYVHSYVYGTCKTGGSFALSNSPTTSNPEKVEAYDAVNGRAIDKTSYTDAVSNKGISRSLNPDHTSAVDNDVTTLGTTPQGIIWCEDKTPSFQAANDPCL